MRQALTFYGRAIAYFMPDWRRIAVLVVLIGISVCVGVLEPWPIAILVDSVLAKAPDLDHLHRTVMSFLPRSAMGQVVALVLITMALQIVGYGVWLARMMINYRLNYAGTTRVRHDLFAKLQHLDISYHRAQPRGDAIYRLSTDAFGPWGMMDTIIGTAVAGVTLASMTIIMLNRNASLTFAAFAIAPVMAGSNLWFGRRILSRALASKQVDTDLTSFVQRSMAAVGLAQAYRREEHEIGSFQAVVRRSVQALLRLNWQEQLYPFARDSILAIGAAVIFGFGGYLVYRDQFAAPVAGGMTIGTLLVFMDYLRKLWDPLKWLTEFVAKVQIFAAAARRVFWVLDTPQHIHDRADAISLPLRPRTLRLNAVGFAYREDRPILNSVSAHIAPGEMVAFIGPSGAGKSTLLNLIMRFYDPTRGAILLDDHDFRRLRVEDLRRHMALVEQDTPMLPLTIAENIAYGRPEARRAQIEAAAEQAGAAEFIGNLPDGYDTVLTEGGGNLSGGQRQRIAIARALLTEAPILVLDEPTSALDEASERRLTATMRDIKGTRTIVLVTHRLESIVDCDRVFVMRAGRVVEEGTYQELFAERIARARGRQAASRGPKNRAAGVRPR